MQATRAVLCLVCGGLLLGLAQRADAQQGDVDDKIDPLVRQLMNRGGAVPVILLAKTQLLSGAEAFPEFCKNHADRKRSELRAELIARLKEIAADDQPAILEALGDPDDAVSLWLVNAVALTLAPEKIREAAGLESVKYVYPAGAIPPAGDAGQVAEVIKPAERKPFSTEGKKVPWNVEMVNASRVWEKYKVTGEGAVVAMFDDGVNYRHTDLRNNVWTNPGETPNNGVDDDGNGLVDDYYGFDFTQMKCAVIAAGRQQHGTMTSGIVAGDGTGGTVTGVAPRARLLLIRGFGGPYVVARAHQYAVAQGADAMNMSFSIPGQGNTRGFWRLLSEQATCCGLVLVSGAGNFQRSARIPVQLRVPEGIPCVIAAGGVDQRLEVPPFCSLGPVEWGSVKFYEDYPMPQGLTKPDVCSFPGPNYPVLASANRGYIDPNNRIAGNSFSGPHVAGAAALVLSAAPETPAWRVKEILESTATDIDPQGKDNRTGAGLLNAYKAVRSVIPSAAGR